MSNELIPISDIERMAQAVAKSALFGMKTPEQALALMLISQAEGRHPALAARDYDIVQGRPSKKAEAMLRDFLAAGGKVEWQELSDERVAATFSHPNGGSVLIDWTMERAKTAGLGGKDNWKKYPRQMLRSRVVSEGVRTVYPAATSGMYVPEEVIEFSTQHQSRTEAVKQALQGSREGLILEGAVEPQEARTEAGVVPVVNVETGEVVGEIRDPEVIIACLEQADDKDELEEAAGWAKDIKDAGFKARARDAYRRRRTALDAPKA